ncbi:hypothetical protein PC118_g12980 [Phytophthora cactorum]|uniref:Uncharacterized protein n=1 Tax=Phytophthora cactorum TaxID=29920 RepID=A0A8T1FK75_9STRA|nr:hypothetical protein PC112_g12760 [Phytophthora cactorum]KAG2820442.1 hypothetical protein PC111_g11472 [Phytophthora cactorum]KAG2977253.1 hypothetical protein PC118_g12980 [Phytophthora cactorum]
MLDDRPTERAEPFSPVSIAVNTSRERRSFICQLINRDWQRTPAAGSQILYMICSVWIHVCSCLISRIHRAGPAAAH